METKLMKLIIEEKSVSSTKVQKVYGRLIGFIDGKECKAILNTEGAARKIFTSESVQLTDCIGTMIDRRLVFAAHRSAEASGQQGNRDFYRKILISPVVKVMVYSRDRSMIFKYGGGKSYTLQEADGD